MASSSSIAAPLIPTEIWEDKILPSLDANGLSTLAQTNLTLNALVKSHIARSIALPPLECRKIPLSLRKIFVESMQTVVNARAPAITSGSSSSSSSSSSSEAPINPFSGLFAAIARPSTTTSAFSSFTLSEAPIGGPFAGLYADIWSDEEWSAEDVSENEGHSDLSDDEDFVPVSEDFRRISDIDARELLTRYNALSFPDRQKLKDELYRQNLQKGYGQTVADKVVEDVGMAIIRNAFDPSEPSRYNARDQILSAARACAAAYVFSNCVSRNPEAAFNTFTFEEKQQLRQEVMKRIVLVWKSREFDLSKLPPLAPFRSIDFKHYHFLFVNQLKLQLNKMFALESSLRSSTNDDSESLAALRQKYDDLSLSQQKKLQQQLITLKAKNAIQLAFTPGPDMKESQKMVKTAANRCRVMEQLQTMGYLTPIKRIKTFTLSLFLLYHETTPIYDTQFIDKDLQIIRDSFLTLTPQEQIIALHKVVSQYARECGADDRDDNNPNYNHYFTDKLIQLTRGLLKVAHFGPQIERRVISPISGQVIESYIAPTLYFGPLQNALEKILGIEGTPPDFIRFENF